MFPIQAQPFNSDEFFNEAQGKMTDVEIREAIYHGLLKDDVLYALEYYEIDVNVKNGVIYLNGHVVSATSQSWIESAIRAIPGILGIKSNLVLDHTLNMEVGAALGKLGRTYPCQFSVNTSRGVVSLTGMVGDENVKLLAEKCAADNPNVRGVVNQVRVSGAKMRLQDGLFLQPSIGAIIYFLDGTFGVIQQVIINPNNRRVIQVIVRGQFSGQEQGLRTLTNNQAEILEKAAVIPVNLIGYLTSSSGFLTIESTQTSQYADFNPSSFAAPNIDWVPPYPYCLDEVLFTADVAGTENRMVIGPDFARLSISAQPVFPTPAEISPDIVAAWEDDGRKIIQNAAAAR